MNESKSIVDIRNKRLNYYSKILENNSDKASKKEDDKIRNVSNIDKRNSLPISLVNKSEPISKDADLPEKNADQFDILDKFFAERDTVKQQYNYDTKNLQHSLSLDSSSAITFTSNHSFINPKLEQFKRVVEDSYAQHVLHKNENFNLFKSPGSNYSRYLDDIFSINNTPRNQNPNNNLIESSRVSFSFNNTDFPLNEENYQNNDLLKKNDKYGDILDTPTSASNLPCKIPYMSAYNIYNKNNEIIETLDNVESSRNQKLNESNLNTKKPLSSNGSSLTTSPTSVSSSSAESIKKLAAKNSEIDTLNELVISNIKNNDIQLFNMPLLKQSESEPQESQASYRGNSTNKIVLHEAKPPETPRTNKSANLITFRKNFLINNNNNNIINRSNEQSNTELNKPNEIRSESIKQFEKKNSLDEKNISRPSLGHSSISNQTITNNPNNQVNLYTRSNSISEQMIKDQFTWDMWFNKEPSLISLNSSANFSKKKLEPIDRDSSKLTTKKPTGSTNSNINKLSISNKNKKPMKINYNNNNNNNNKDSKNKNNWNNKLKRKPSKNNIFNYIEDENVVYDEDDDEGCDTFDMFSSDEDDNINSKNIVMDNVTKTVDNKNAYTDNLNFKLDLAQLSGDEDSLNNIFKKNNQENQINKQNNQNKEENEESYNLNDIINSYSSRTQQQIKPDNIPNLCLDLIEDDKSQSVAASLAKSMCKEIDYKKEMEILSKQPVIQNYEPQIPNYNQSISNKVKASINQFSNGNTNKASKLNQKMDNEMTMHTNNTDSFLNAASNLSTRQPSLRNNDDPLNSSRPGSSTFFHRKSQKPHLQVSNSISVPKRPSSAAIMEKNKFMVRKPGEKFNSYIEKKPIPKQSINLMSSSSMSNLKENQQTELSGKKNSKETNNEKFYKPRRPHWVTSTSMSVRKSLQRPSSAFALSNKKSKNENNNFEILNTQSKQPIEPQEPKMNINSSTLFLNYSRLIEIETKLKSEIESEYQKDLNSIIVRPSSAQNDLTKSTVNLKFGLSELEENNHEKINFYNSQMCNENHLVNNNNGDNDNQKLGDQDAYKKLMNELINKHENLIENTENDKEIDQNRQADWLSLPDELWLHIFSFLRQVDLMNIGNSCKKFNSLYVDNTLWRVVTMKYKYNMKDEWLDWIGKRRPNELNIIQCSGNITLRAISDMFKNIGDKLNSLNLSRCSNEYLSGDNFALQASIRCKNVTCLDLSWTLLSNQTLKLISESFLRIESINLSGCNMIQEDGFNFLLMQHGEFLKNLEISGCLHFSSNCILNIGVYCRGLERLNISNCHRMTSDAIIEACPHWVKLRHLDLRGIKSVKNNCISVLVRKCANLESLALADCVHVGDNSVLEISTYRQNIKYLDLNGCKKISDNSIRSLANFCANIEYLNLKGTSATDIGLMNISNGKFVKNLVELNLSFLPVSELVVMKLLQNSEKLKSIHLYGCYNVKHVDDLRKAYGVNHNQNYLTINI